MSKKIILDCDPGHDDAVAIMLAVASDEIDLIGITCVGGNATLENTKLNTLKICSLLNRQDISIYAGANKPMFYDLVTAEHVHGDSGLDGAPLPAPVMAVQSTHAVDFIIDSLRAAPPKTITLCPLGPLTNIATALERAPDIADRIAQVVLMGGAYFEVGNITPAAEFNIFVDPEAAQLVFQSGLDLVVAPLDVTHKALTSPAWSSALRAQNHPVCDVVAGWTEFFERFDTQKYGSEGAPLHDPCVIAYLIAPELFSGRKINVEIETQSELTRGMTVADWWRVTDRPANAMFLGHIDAEKYFELITQRLARL